LLVSDPLLEGIELVNCFADELEARRLLVGLHARRGLRGDLPAVYTKV